MNELERQLNETWKRNADVSQYLNEAHARGFRDGVTAERREQAAEIEALKAERDKLRAAVESIAAHDCYDGQLVDAENGPVGSRVWRPCTVVYTDRSDWCAACIAQTVLTAPAVVD